MCDNQAQITQTVARCPGSTHDIRLFDNTRLCTLLEGGEISGYLVGYSGYASRIYLTTPDFEPSDPGKEKLVRALTLFRAMFI